MATRYYMLVDDEGKRGAMKIKTGDVEKVLEQVKKVYSTTVEISKGKFQTLTREIEKADEK